MRHFSDIVSNVREYCICGVPIIVPLFCPRKKINDNMKYTNKGTDQSRELLTKWFGIESWMR